MKHKQLIALFSSALLLAMVAVSCNGKNTEAEQKDAKSLVSIEDYFIGDSAIETHVVAVEEVPKPQPAPKPTPKPVKKVQQAPTPAETIYVETEGAQGRVWGHVTLSGDRGTGTIHDWDENTLAVTVTRHGNELFAVDQNSRQYVFKLKQNNTK